MIADDLFAGAGGWDLAAAQLGIHARGVENMKEARATRDAAGLTTIHDDVWTYRPDGTATGLIASPPCQTFSAAGKGSGRKALDDVLGAIWSGAHMDIDALRDVGEQVGDARTALVLTPLHFALTGGYEWLAWEQVPTVLPVWQACVEVLRAAGWKAWAGLAQAEMYGVPQTRKRAFLIASRRGIAETRPTHSRYYARNPSKLDEGVAKWVSMAEALNWGCAGDVQLRNNNTANAAVRLGSTPAPTLYFGQRCNYCAWSLATTNVRDGEYQSRPVDEPAPTITSAARSFRWGEPPLLVETPGRKGGNMQENRVTRDHLPDWCHNRPSTVVMADPRIAAPGHRCMVKDCHPDRPTKSMMLDSVRVTVQEAGILQSFPADYPWQGAKGKQFLQAGNAIPPGLALPALSAATSIVPSTLEESA